jgi:hypothetical protein
VLRKKGAEEKAVKAVKVSPKTHEELEKARGLMIFHYGRNVTYDEVIRALLEFAPKKRVTFAPLEEGEDVERGVERGDKEGA